MPDQDSQIPPDIDTANLDDKNFASGDLSQAWGILGLSRFVVQRDNKDVESYFIEDAQKKRQGLVVWVQNGGWSIEGPPGQRLGMLWRQHTEDHQQENLRNLVHLGLHRYEQALKSEQNASIYCLANPDRTVRMFVTYKGSEAILDSPSNRPVLKMAKGSGAGEIQLTDGFDDPVATIRTEKVGALPRAARKQDGVLGLPFAEAHDVTLTEAEDPFPVALFAVTLGIEMTLRYGEWRSPYQHLQL